MLQGSAGLGVDAALIGEAHRLAQCLAPGEFRGLRGDELRVASEA
jgi:hypothetical protein